MNAQEFVNLYTLQPQDETVIPFDHETGFSLIRFYPKGTLYHSDDKRMFIKVAALDQGFYYSVDMTKLQNRDKSTTYTITDGEQYKKKITNFSSDGAEKIVFDEDKKQVVYFIDAKKHKFFSLNEFVEILVFNHLKDRLFLKRKINAVINIFLKSLFWLSDRHYERIQVSVDKYHFGRDNKTQPMKTRSTEPFFKYFFISKNILFTTLLITFPAAIFLDHFWTLGDFSLSNPSIILLFFLILFSCEKFSGWLECSVKNFFKNNSFNERINFIERLHNYQYQNSFKLELK